jgi:hypothetical protein
MPSVIVINDNAIVDGTIDGNLFIINGRAEINGAVGGDVIVAGDVFLDAGARVGRNVSVYGGALTRAAGATVDGAIKLEESPSFEPPSALAVFLAVLVSALGLTLLLTLVAWRPLSNSAALFMAHPFNVLVIGVFVALSAPAAAIALLPTGIGVLLGLAVLICVIPAAIACGFAVAALAVGDWIALREPNLVPGRPHTRALAEVTIGVVAAMVVLLIPVAGVLLLLLASTMGVGALATRAWESWPRRAAVPPMM